jgi:hypothetical protein
MAVYTMAFEATRTHSVSTHNATDESMGADMLPTRVIQTTLTVGLGLLVVMSAGCGVVRIVPPDDSGARVTKPQNLGFEGTGPHGGAKSWVRNQDPEDAYVLALDDEVFRSGRYSARTEFKSGGLNEIGQRWGAWDQRYRISPLAGKVLHVKGWIKTRGAESCAKCLQPGHDIQSLPEPERRGAEIRINQNPESYKMLTPLVVGTSDWTLFEARATITPPVPSDIAVGADVLTVSPILWGKGTAWFDDLEVRIE